MREGPDGRFYAVGGSIAVDLHPAPGDPEATARKARSLIAAAFAPGNPSGADLRTAARAYQIEMEAKQEFVDGSVRLDGARRRGIFA